MFALSPILYSWSFSDGCLLPTFKNVLAVSGYLKHLKHVKDCKLNYYFNYTLSKITSPVDIQVLSKHATYVTIKLGQGQ